MLSVIIPTLDEVSTLARTLTQLQRMAGDFEVLVVDGESRDATRKIAEQMGVRVIKSERGVDRQLAHGIVESKGDMYLFLHADCQLPQEAILALNDLKGPIAGAFRHQYDSFNPILSLQSTINNLNARLFRQYSGEQAIFISKDALRAIGGIPEAFVLEDRKLSAALRREKIPTKLLDGPVVSSGRRFKRGLGVMPFLRVNWAHALHGFVSDYKLKKHFPAVR